MHCMRSIMCHIALLALFLVNSRQNGFTAAVNSLSRLQGPRVSPDVSSDFCSWHTFWNASSRHFYASRAVFVIMLSSSGMQLETERVATLLAGMNDILSVPVIVLCGATGTSTYNITRDIFPSDVRFRKSYAFLLVSEDVNSILEYTETSERLWRPDVSVLILIIQRENGNVIDKTVLSVEYSDIFKNLWLRHKTGKVLLFVKLLNQCDDEILYYNPFVEANTSERGQVCKHTFTGAVDRCFQNGIWNLHGYSLHISMFPFMVTAIEETVNNSERHSSYKYRGRDGLLLEELTKHMNFTPEIIKPYSVNSFEFSDGRLTGTLKGIANGDVDIAMNSVFMKVFRSVDIEYVTPVTHFGKICVLVPKAPKIPVWVSLFRCFSVTLWATLICTYFVAAIFWHILRKLSLSHQSQKDIHWNTSLIDVLNVFLPICFVKIFSYNNQSERMFVASCMLSSIVITCLWQGALFNTLKNPIHHREIDTLEDLDESGLPIFTTEEVLHDIFDLIDTPVTRRLSKRFRLTNFPENFNLLQQVADHRNFSFLLSLVEIDTLFDTYPMSTRLLHCVQECPMIYFSSYMVPKGSPYLKDVNTIVGRLYEAGLISKWYYDAINEIFLPFRFRNAGAGIQNLKQKEFSLSDLLIAFMVLVFGSGLGGVVLLIELFLSKFQHLAQHIT